jgi:hypothetical protein
LPVQENSPKCKFIPTLYYQLRITNYELRITNYELRIPNAQCPMPNAPLPFNQLCIFIKKPPTQSLSQQQS